MPRKQNIELALLLACEAKRPAADQPPRLSMLQAEHPHREQSTSWVKRHPFSLELPVLNLVGRSSPTISDQSSPFILHLQPLFSNLSKGTTELCNLSPQHTFSMGFLRNNSQIPKSCGTEVKNMRIHLQISKQIMAMLSCKESLM